MLTDKDKRRLQGLWRAAADDRRKTEAPLGKWRGTPMGAIGSELAPLLQRFSGQRVGSVSGLAAYDFHSALDPSGARAIVAMMLDAAIKKIGPDNVGACFAVATQFRKPDVIKLMRAFGHAYGFKELRHAVGKVQQRGEIPSGSATLVYVWTEVCVRGEIDPWTYSHRPGIKPADVFTAMGGRKWFLDKAGRPFKAPRATLSTYYRRLRNEIARDAGKAAAVAALIQIRLSRLVHDDKSTPPVNQRWPRPLRPEK